MLHDFHGVVIRTIDYGESDKVVVLFTLENGKMSVMAKGAKKVRSRHAAITQLFTHGKYRVYSSSSMGTLNSGEIIQSRYPLRNDLIKTAYASYLSELIDQMMLPHEASAALFQQFNGALDLIEQEKDAQIVTNVFELKMLQVAGFDPIVSYCSQCSSKENLERWSAKLGGLICKRCLSHDVQALPLSPKCIQVLQILKRVDLLRVGNINVSEQTKSECKKAIRLFFDEHVSGRWRARNFLDRLDQMV